MEMAESTGSCGRSTQSKEIEEERKIGSNILLTASTPPR